MEEEASSRRKERGSGHKDTILDLIGNTPLIKINRLAREFKNVEIYVKAEWFNPGGSIKDRAALSMIEDGERRGLLAKGKTILDSSSGNTGIAYAMIGAVKGYPVEVVIPANASEERKRIIRAYGGVLTFTDPLEGSDGAIREAHRLYKKNPQRYFMPDQYNNLCNPLTHYMGTGVEIIKGTDGKVTHFLAGIGTGGTIMGVGRRLKESNPTIQILAVEPKELIHGIEGLKYMEASIVPGIYNEALLDGKIKVATEEAYHMVQRLAEEEGLLVGYSSGAVMSAALKLAQEIKEGYIVMIFADGGDRYLSTSFWENFCYPKKK